MLSIFPFQFSMRKCRYGIAVVPERQPERQCYCNPQCYFPHLPWWLKTQATKGEDHRTALCSSFGFSAQCLGLRKGAYRSE